MTETDWELKDRRIAWQSITKALAEVQAALIQSKMVKFGSLSEAMEDLNKSRTIELASFLVIRTEVSHPGIGEPTGEVGQESHSSPSASFNSPGVLVASPPSPKKERKMKGVKTTGFFCSECQAPIEEWVKDYSEKNMQKALCYDCQDEYREKKREQNEGIENAMGPKDIGKY